MGLNYVRRPPREELDPPNDLITAALGTRDYRMHHNDEHIIMEFEKEILDKVEEKYRRLNFTDSPDIR